MKHHLDNEIKPVSGEFVFSLTIKEYDHGKNDKFY